MSTDPTTLAREVLDEFEASKRVMWDADVEEGKYTHVACVNAPDLARAALRVEALADRLENEAAYKASRGDTWDAVCLRSEADRIRTALNGDNK